MLALCSWILLFESGEYLTVTAPLTLAIWTTVLEARNRQESTGKDAGLARSGYATAMEHDLEV